MKFVYLFNRFYYIYIIYDYWLPKISSILRVGVSDWFYGTHSVTYDSERAQVWEVGDLKSFNYSISFRCFDVGIGIVGILLPRRGCVYPMDFRINVM